MSTEATPATDKPKPTAWVPLMRDYQLEEERLSVRSQFQRVKDREHPLHPLFSRSTSAHDQTAAPAAAALASPPAAVAGVVVKGQSDELDPLSMLAAASKSDGKSAGFIDPLGAFAEAKSAPNVAASLGLRVPDLKPSEPVGGRSRRDSLSEVRDRLAADSKQNSNLPLFTQQSTGHGETWASKKARILQKYTTDKRLAVTANFLEEKAKDTKPVAVDQMQSRLEQLETDPESDTAKNFLTQKEYIAHIETQHANLRQAWDNGERVLALKIAIQCAKLLGDTAVPQFYPSMYVLLSEIMDTFGTLVFDRIKRKGMVVSDASRVVESATALPDNFKLSDVSVEAQETCRNWFFKTACIRELLPRLYIELSLIKCNRFIAENDCFLPILTRLSKAIRGIGDPVVAVYARAYLSTKFVQLLPYLSKNARGEGDMTCLLSAFDDFLFTYRSLRETNWQSVAAIKNEKMELDAYVDLMSPAVEWILQNIGQHSNEDMFFALVRQYRDYCNHSSVLIHLLNCFDPRFISAHAMKMTQLIKEAVDSSVVAKSKLYLTLGQALVVSAPPENQLLPILNDVWKVVTKIQDPKEYCEIAVVFIEYLLLHFTEREVNIFLKDVIKHVKKDGAYKDLQPLLYAIVQKIMSRSQQLDKTLGMDNLLPLLDLLEKEQKANAAKHILLTLSNSATVASDPVILHTLFDVARNLHDSVDSLSFEDERRQISQLIIQFVRKIDFGRDLEKQLSTFVECRQAFTNLDAVTGELVMRVALLCMKAHQFMKGKHTKKTAAFVKACLAYCHITIPSLDDLFRRLQLFLLCGQVALVNCMIVQGEAFIRAAISLIPDIPTTREVNGKTRSTEDELMHFVRSLTSFLVVFPGHPEHGPFFLVTRLLTAVQKYQPWSVASPNKVRVYLGVLQLFCTYYQRNFPYHIPRVESNDRLYGGDAAYIGSLLSVIDTLMGEILVQLNEIGERGDISGRKEQGELALELANILVSNMEMRPQSATLVVKLYQLAKNSGAVSQRSVAALLAHVQSRKGTWYQDIAKEMLAPRASS